MQRLTHVYTRSTPRLQFPIAQKVTYKFYEGRLAVFDEHYEEAQEALAYALTHCHSGSKKNIALILKYLVPVGLLLGRLPSPNLVREYSGVLSPYLPIANAVRTGNVGAFYEAMDAQRNRLVKDGTLLLLEKLQASVYRRLLRRVYIVHAQMEPAKAAQIPLAMYEQALRVAGVTLDMSEIECTSLHGWQTFLLRCVSRVSRVSPHTPRCHLCRRSCPSHVSLATSMRSL